MKEMMKKYWSEFKIETKTMFKEFFNKDTNKKQRANMWTFTRLTTSFLIPICSLLSILTSSIALFITSIGITSFGAITDFFDGRSARKYNSYSEFGKRLDQMADKVFSLMIGLNLSLFNPLFLINIIGELSIASINTTYKLQYNELDIESTKIGKIKQWPLFTSLILGFISVLVTNLSLITNIFILLTSIFQIATITSYIIENNEKIQNLENNLDKENQIIIKNEEIENVKTKSLENNNKFNNDINNNMTRTEQINLLKNISNEFKNEKIENNQKNKEKVMKK